MPNIEIRIITRCPALMLAARRKDKVIGRKENLEDSTAVRNGFNHAGAPLGRSEAIKVIGRDKIEERAELNHKVNPKERVKSR